MNQQIKELFCSPFGLLLMLLTVVFSGNTNAQSADALLRKCQMLEANPQKIYTKQHISVVKRLMETYHKGENYKGAFEFGLEQTKEPVSWDVKRNWRGYNDDFRPEITALIEELLGRLEKKEDAQEAYLRYWAEYNLRTLREKLADLPASEFDSEEYFYLLQTVKSRFEVTTKEYMLFWDELEKFMKKNEQACVLYDWQLDQFAPEQKQSYFYKDCASKSLLCTIKSHYLRVNAWDSIETKKTHFWYQVHLDSMLSLKGAKGTEYQTARRWISDKFYSRVGQRSIFLLERAYQEGIVCQKNEDFDKELFWYFIDEWARKSLQEREGKKERKSKRWLDNYYYQHLGRMAEPADELLKKRPPQKENKKELKAWADYKYSRIRYLLDNKRTTDNSTLNYTGYLDEVEEYYSPESETYQKFWTLLLPQIDMKGKHLDEFLDWIAQKQNSAPLAIREKWLSAGMLYRNIREKRLIKSAKAQTQVQSDCDWYWQRLDSLEKVVGLGDAMYWLAWDTIHNQYQDIPKLQRMFLNCSANRFLDGNSPDKKNALVRTAQIANPLYEKSRIKYRTDLENVFHKERFKFRRIASELKSSYKKPDALSQKAKIRLLGCCEIPPPSPWEDSEHPILRVGQPEVYEWMVYEQEDIVEEEVYPEPEPEIFTFIQYDAQFAGCRDANRSYRKQADCAAKKLQDYLDANLVYPKKAERKKITGTVVVIATVNKAGRLENIKLKKRLQGDCDEEALRIAHSMNETPNPVWEPAEQRGKAVPMEVEIPIEFISKKRG